MSGLSDLLKPVTDALRREEVSLADAADKLLARLNGKLDEEEKRLLAWVATHLAASQPLVDQPTAETPDQLAEQTTGEAPAASPAESVSSPTNEPTTAPAQTVVDGAQGAGTVGQGADPTAADSGQPIT